MGGDAIRGADHEPQPCPDRLDQRIRRPHARHEDDSRLRTRGGARLSDGIEDGNRLMVAPALSGRDSRDDPGPVVAHDARVEGPFTPRETLDDDPRLAIEQDAHAALPRAAATAAATAPRRVGSLRNPFAAISERPRSASVPSRRMMRGARRPGSRSSAARMDSAT